MQSPALLKNAQTAQQGSESTAEVYVSYYLLTADCFSVFQRTAELSRKGPLPAKYHHSGKRQLLSTFFSIPVKADRK